MTRISRMSGAKRQPTEGLKDTKKCGLAGERTVLSSLTFVRKIVSARRRNQHASRVCSPEVLFWREGGDDFFEARLAAQRVPERHQFQLPIREVETAGVTDGGGKLFAGEILFTDPRSNHCKICDHVETID